MITSHRLYILIGLCLVLFCPVLTGIYTHPLAPEAAVHVECANQMLSGKTLYTEVIDLDPPLSDYVAVVPVFFARHSNIQICHAYSFFVLLISISATTLLGLILAPKLKEAQGFLLAPLLLSFAGIDLFVGPDFGVNQHLAIRLLVPYLVVRWLRLNGSEVNRWLSLAAGALAAVAINLEWIFYLFIFAIELYVLFGGKFRSIYRAPEFLIVIALTLIYGLHFAVLPPEARATYFSFLAPLSYEIAMNWDFAFRVGSPDRRAVLYLFLPILVLSFSMFEKRSILAPLVLSALAGLVAYVWYGKGYSHQLVYASCTCLLVGSVMAAEFANQFAKKMWSSEQVSKAFIPVLFLLSFFAIFLHSSMYERRFKLHFADGTVSHELSPFENKLSKLIHSGDSVLFIIPQARPGYPLIPQMGLVPGSRWLYMFPLQLILSTHMYNQEQLDVFNSDLAKQVHSQEFYKVVAQKLFDSLDDDVQKNKPKFILLPGDLVVGISYEHNISKTIAKDYDGVADLSWKEYKEFQDLSQTHLEVLGNEQTFKLYQRH